MEEVLVPGGKPLSEVERVVDTFIAPSKTFTDILRSASWWLPFVLACVVSIASAFTVDKKIGFDTVAQQALTRTPKIEDQMAQMPPEQRALQMHYRAIGTRISTYCAPVFILIISLICALVLWATFNFGLGAQARFGQMLAVWMFAGLPKMFIWILSIILLYANVNTETFDLQNPVGTNPAYYLHDASPVIKTALSFFDVFSLWSLVLLILGTAIITRKSKGQAAAVVMGWWVVCLLLIVGVTAAFS